MALEKVKAMLAAAPQTIENAGRVVTSGRKISRDSPPKDDYKRYRAQYRTNGLVSPALDLRATEVIRPGYRVEVGDEEGEDAEDDDGESLADQLEEWGDKAAFYSREREQPLLPMLWQVARDLDLDGTVLAECVWDDPENRNSLEGVKQFDPAQTDFIIPDGSSLLPEPDPEDLPTDDDGKRIGPKERTRAGEVPAYVQYPDGWGFAKDEIFLSQNDVLKLTRSPGFGDNRGFAGDTPKQTEFGPGRGVSLVESVADENERFEARLQDYNASLAAQAYPRLKAQFSDYERGNQVVAWSREDMQSYMGNVTREEDEKKYSLDGDWTDPGGSVASPPGVEIELVEGSVPDVIPSLHFSVDYILSGLRVPKAMVGFGDDINRDITGDQREVFNQDILQRRRTIERKFLTPLFRMKAREIRGAGPFDESVDVSDVKARIEPEESENPLKDDEFDPAEFKTLVEGAVTILDSSAEVYFEQPQDVLRFLGDLINMDLTEYAADEELENAVDEAMGPFEEQQPEPGEVPDELEEQQREPGAAPEELEEQEQEQEQEEPPEPPADD